MGGYRTLRPVTHPILEFSPSAAHIISSLIHHLVSTSLLPVYFHQNWNIIRDLFYYRVWKVLGSAKCVQPVVIFYYRLSKYVFGRVIIISSLFFFFDLSTFGCPTAINSVEYALSPIVGLWTYAHKHRKRSFAHVCFALCTTLGPIALRCGRAYTHDPRPTRLGPETCWHNIIIVYAEVKHYVMSCATSVIVVVGYASLFDTRWVTYTHCVRVFCYFMWSGCSITAVIINNTVSR